MHRSVIGFIAVLAIVALAGASTANWQLSDSLPSLYNSYAAYCDTKYLSTWSCGFCSHNPGVKFVGFLENSFTSTFGFVIINNNESMYHNPTFRSPSDCSCLLEVRHLTHTNYLKYECNNECACLRLSSPSSIPWVRISSQISGSLPSLLPIVYDEIKTKD